MTSKTVALLLALLPVLSPTPHSRHFAPLPLLAAADPALAHWRCPTATDWLLSPLAYSLPLALGLWVVGHGRRTRSMVASAMAYGTSLGLIPFSVGIDNLLIAAFCPPFALLPIAALWRHHSARNEACRSP